MKQNALLRKPCKSLNTVPDKISHMSMKELMNTKFVCTPPNKSLKDNQRSNKQ